MTFPEGINSTTIKILLTQLWICGPAWFNNVCILFVENYGRSNLRSAVCASMFVLQTRTEFGQRSFHVAAPAVWNALPAHLHLTVISQGQFWAEVKATHLFNQAYKASF